MVLNLSFTNYCYELTLSLLTLTPVDPIVPLEDILLSCCFAFQSHVTRHPTEMYKKCQLPPYSQSIPLLK